MRFILLEIRMICVSVSYIINVKKLRNEKNLYWLDKDCWSCAVCEVRGTCWRLCCPASSHSCQGRTGKRCCPAPVASWDFGRGPSWETWWGSEGWWLRQTHHLTADSYLMWTYIYIYTGMKTLNLTFKQAYIYQRIP